MAFGVGTTIKTLEAMAGMELGYIAGLLGLALLALLGVGVCWSILLGVTGRILDRLHSSARRNRWTPELDWDADIALKPARSEPSFKGKNAPLLTVDDRMASSHHTVSGPIASADPEIETERFLSAANARPSQRRKQLRLQKTTMAETIAAELPALSADHLPVHHVNVGCIPKPMRLGAIGAARPEWTSKVVGGSLKAAGAEELCHFALREEATNRDGDAVRAVDYRLMSLPRVDSRGHRAPDWLVATVADQGFILRSLAQDRGGFKRR